MKIKARTAAMSHREKMCSLVIDEMAIKGHLDYNRRTDFIDGLTPDGSKARQAVVFMARAINGKWKQVVSTTPILDKFRITVACVKKVSKEHFFNMCSLMFTHCIHM